MAINDNSVLKIATARFYTALVGTPAPVDGAAPEAAWEEVGHTSLESILSLTSEGGERTVLGSLQNRNLRTSYSTRTQTFGFSIHQFDEAGLKLYLGANAITDADGRIGPADNPQPTQCAFYVYIEDGDNFTDFYCAKSEILAAEDLSLADTESLAALPLAVTPLANAVGQAPWAISPVSPKAGAGA